MRRIHAYLGKVKVGGTVVYRRLYQNRLALRIRDDGAVIALSVRGPEAAKYAAVTRFGAKVEVSEVDVKDSQGSDTFVHPYVLVSGTTTLIRENPDLGYAYDLWAGGFTPVDHLRYLPEDGEGLDLLVVLKNVGEMVAHTTASGRVTTRRELEVVDRSGSSVCATLWGQSDPHVNLMHGLVVAVKDAKKKDWGGVTLSMHPNQIVVSPRLPEADALANWWTQHANDAFNRLSASVPVAVNPVMQETISNAILAYRAANAHLSNDDINAGVIELVKSFHH